LAIAAAAEPLAADLRAHAGLSRRRRYDLARLRLVAAILGCGFDDLRQRELQRRRRRAAIGGAAAAAMLLVVAGLIEWRQASHEQQLIAESRQAAEEAQRLLAAKDYEAAARTAAQGLAGKRWHLRETEEALLSALLGRSLEPTGRTVFGTEVVGGMPPLSPDGRFLAVVDMVSNAIRLWSTVEGRQIRQVELKRDKNGFAPFPKVLRFSADARFLIAASDEGSVVLYPTADGAVARPVPSRSKKIFLLDAAARGARLLVVGDGGCEVVDVATSGGWVAGRTRPQP
jgi:hypothetical protein